MKVWQIAKRQQAKARRALAIAMHGVEAHCGERQLTPRLDFWVDRFCRFHIAADRIGAGEELSISYPYLRPGQKDYLCH